MADLIVYRESLVGHEIRLTGTAHIGKKTDYWEFQTSGGLTLGVRNVSSGRHRVHLVKGMEGFYHPQPFVGELLEIRDPVQRKEFSWRITGSG